MSCSGLFSAQKITICWWSHSKNSPTLRQPWHMRKPLHSDPSIRLLNGRFAVNSVALSEQSQSPKISLHQGSPDICQLPEAGNIDICLQNIWPSLGWVPEVNNAILQKGGTITNVAGADQPGRWVWEAAMPDLWSHSICLEYSTSSKEMLWFSHQETALSMRGKKEDSKLQVEMSVDQHSKCVQILTCEQHTQVAYVWTIFTLPNSKSVYCNSCNLLIHIYIVYQKCFVVFGLLSSILTTNSLRLTRQLKFQCAFNVHL